MLSRRPRQTTKLLARRSRNLALSSSDHWNDRYSCADAVQIRRSILYPTAHTQNSCYSQAPLCFMTDRGSEREDGHFVMDAVEFSLCNPRCSGSSDRCSRGVAGSLWPAVVAAAILRRCGVTVCLQLRRRQAQSQVSLVRSTLVGELARARAKLASPRSHLWDCVSSSA